MREARPLGFFSRHQLNAPLMMLVDLGVFQAWEKPNSAFTTEIRAEPENVMVKNPMPYNLDETLIQKDTCIPMFTIGRTWKQLKCPHKNG